MRKIPLILMALCIVLMTACSTETPLKNTVFFEENIGQFDPEVRFVFNQLNRQVFFTDTEIVHRMTPGGEEKPGIVIRQSFPESVPTTPVGNDLSSVQLNRFIGNDEEKWARNIPAYQTLVYKDLSPGLDLVYRLRNNRLTVHLESGDQETELTMKITGIDDLSIDEQGHPLLDTGIGPLRLPNIENSRSERLDFNLLRLQPLKS